MKHKDRKPRILDMKEPVPELGPVALYMAHMAWLDGHDTLAIAKELGVAESAVYNTLSRLREKRRSPGSPSKAI